MLPWLTSWALETLDLFRLMAPYLLLGLVLAGLLHVTVPKAWVTRHMGGGGLGAAVKASLVGIPLPLCSCGVIPFADSLKRQGASKTSITAFLIATPQTGVDSILATSAMLGPVVALWRVVTALVSGVIGGTLAGVVDPEEPVQAETTSGGGAGLPVGWKAKARELLSYGMGMLMEDIAFWLLVGMVVGGAIGAFVPDDLFTSAVSHPVLQWGAVMAVAVPLYVCATGSIPIAAALVAKGLPLGAAIVFLIAGPATNVATLTVFTKALGKRVVAVYLGTIVVVSLAFGLAFEAIFPGTGLPVSMAHSHEHGLLASVSWWEWASSAVLAVALSRALWIRAVARVARWRPASAPETCATQAGENDMDIINLDVQGMTCQHCSGSVEKALSAMDGVRAVDVTLATGRVVVYGNGLDTQALIATVVDKGYEAQLAKPQGGGCGCNCGCS
jgi:uncharacterized membrane protein YraQ (UPF0718 family)/copper chaperone CopZ